MPPRPPNFGRSIISISTRRQQIMPPIYGHMPILPLPQIIRPSAVRVTDHGSAAEEGKNQSNSILLVANIPHALPALNIRNTNVKRLKKLVENWKKCPHSEHLLDDEKGTTEKNSTLLHCVSPVSSFVLSLWGIGKTPVVLCIISGLQFSNSGRSLYSWRGRFMRKV